MLLPWAYWLKLWFYMMQPRCMCHLRGSGSPRTCWFLCWLERFSQTVWVKRVRKALLKMFETKCYFKCASVQFSQGVECNYVCFHMSVICCPLWFSVCCSTILVFVCIFTCKEQEIAVQKRQKYVWGNESVTTGVCFICKTSRSVYELVTTLW